MNHRSPSYGYTKDQLRQLALAGVREKLREMEQELARIQHEFPGVLATTEPIVLLKAEARPNGHSAWPLKAATPRKSRTRSQSSPAIKRQRMHSAKVLAKLSTDDPRPLADRVNGLIRHGYIRSAGKNANGKTVYLRTDKEFTV